MLLEGLSLLQLQAAPSLIEMNSSPDAKGFFQATYNIDYFKQPMLPTLMHLYQKM